MDGDGIGDVCDTACIATQVLGCNNPRLNTIRQFRDGVLVKNALSRKLIEFYYKNEGSTISILDRHPTVKKTAMEVLESLVPVMEIFFKK